MDLRALVPEWIRTLTPYSPGKPIEEVERELGIAGSIKLASNENPLGPSPRALAAITAALGELHRYPDGSAYYLKRHLAERLGVAVERLVVGSGSSEVIELAVQALLRPGDEAVVADQAFIMYRLLTQAAGATARVVPLRDYTHDLSAMAAAITSRTRMVFLGNPNNPTGTIFRRPAWETFLRDLPPDVVVIADEAYAEYVDDPDYPDTIHERGGGGAAIVSTRTFSKLYGLAGLRIGYGVGPAELVEVIERLRPPFNVGSVALAGALAALDDVEHVTRTRAVNREGRAYLAAAFARLGLSSVPSAANFLLVQVGPAMQVYEALLREGVIVRPMGAYGFPQHLRVTVGLPAENRRLIETLAGVLRDSLPAAGSRT